MKRIGFSFKKLLSLTKWTKLHTLDHELVPLDYKPYELPTVILNTKRAEAEADNTNHSYFALKKSKRHWRAQVNLNTQTLLRLHNPK